MATNNKELAASIVELLGGSSNISTALHCVTRLRFNLRDDSLAKLDDIRQLKGVLGAQIKDGQYQVIIGPNVNRVYDEVVPLLDSSAAADKPSSAGKVKGDLWREYRRRHLSDPEHDLGCAVLFPPLPAGHLCSTQVQGE